jgi:hypothetical protein
MLVLWTPVFYCVTLNISSCGLQCGRLFSSSCNCLLL